MLGDCFSLLAYIAYSTPSTNNLIGGKKVQVMITMRGIGGVIYPALVATFCTMQ